MGCAAASPWIFEKEQKGEKEAEEENTSNGICLHKSPRGCDQK